MLILNIVSVCVRDLFALIELPVIFHFNFNSPFTQIIHLLIWRILGNCLNVMELLFFASVCFFVFQRLIPLGERKWKVFLLYGGLLPPLLVVEYSNDRLLSKPRADRRKGGVSGGGRVRIEQRKAEMQEGHRQQQT